MAYLVFLDEQEGRIGGEKFSAIVGFRVASSDMQRIRKSFYPRFNDLLDEKIRGRDRVDDRHIYMPPVLHGSEFLPDFNDAEKFSVLDALSDAIQQVPCNFFRIGYFDRSFDESSVPGSRDTILNMSLLGAALALWDKPEDEHILVSEIDKEALRKKIESTFNNSGMYYTISPENVSYNVERMIGHYYAPKTELGCQIADVFNYCCLKDSSIKTEFGERLAQYYRRFSDRYICNEIIWLNDNERTWRFR